MAINNPNNQQNQQPSNRQGTGFTNLQQLMAANQGNKLGQAIGSGIQKSGEQVKSGLQSGQQQFQEGTQKEVGRIAPEVENLTKNVLGDVTKTAGTDQGKQFTDLLRGQYGGGSYRGPMELQNAQKLKSQAQDVTQQAQELGTAQGRQGLLERYVGSPQYTSGQKRLDTLLLGQTGGKDLTQARRSGLGLTGQAQQQIGGAEAQALQAKGKFQNILQHGTQEAGKQFGEQVTGLTGQLQERAKQFNTKEQQQYQDLLKAAGSGELTQEQADKLGLKEGDTLYNIFKNKPESLITAGEQATAQNVTNPEEYAKIQALQKIGGGVGPQDAQSALNKYMSAGQATTPFDATKYTNASPDQIKAQLQHTGEAYNTASGDMLRAHDAEVNNNRTAARGVAAYAIQKAGLGNLVDQYGLGNDSVNAENVQNAIADANTQIAQKIEDIKNQTVTGPFGQVINPNDFAYQSALGAKLDPYIRAQQELRRPEISNFNNALASRNSALQDVYNQYGAGQKVKIVPGQNFQGLQNLMGGQT